MTINEIRNKLRQHNLTIKDFAEELGVAYSTLRAVLSENYQMTEQLKRHIELALAKREERKQTLICEIPHFLYNALSELEKKIGLSPEVIFEHIARIVLFNLSNKISIDITDKKG